MTNENDTNNIEPGALTVWCADVHETMNGLNVALVADDMDKFGEVCSLLLDGLMLVTYELGDADVPSHIVSLVQFILYVQSAIQAQSDPEEPVVVNLIEMLLDIGRQIDANDEADSVLGIQDAV